MRLTLLILNVVNLVVTVAQGLGAAYWTLRVADDYAAYPDWLASNEATTSTYQWEFAFMWTSCLVFWFAVLYSLLVQIHANAKGRAKSLLPSFLGCVYYPCWNNVLSLWTSLVLLLICLYCWGVVCVVVEIVLRISGGNVKTSGAHAILLIMATFGFCCGPAACLFAATSLPSLALSRIIRKSYTTRAADDNLGRGGETQPLLGPPPSPILVP